MRRCSCHGILAKAQAAFADRVVGWVTASRIWRRSGTVSVHVVCEECGAVWAMELAKKAEGHLRRHRCAHSA